MSDIPLRLLIVAVGAAVLPWVTFRLLKEMTRHA